MELLIDGKSNTYRGSGSKEDYLMNILVIGNGFDLAHGLPTKYGDFWSSVDDKKDL